jgi:phytoene desaturase
MENLFILIPVAPDLKDTEEIRQKYFEIVIKRLEALCEDEIKEHIVYNRSYCINDFKADYHAYKGNAYGLANTLRQTAVLKPTMRNKKVKNMFFAGQLTVPGPGVPPALVSGQVAAQQLLKTLK